MPDSSLPTGKPAGSLLRDFVNVPRTFTGALKAPAARAAPGPLKPPHSTHPPGAAIFLF